jgi:putative PIN family toxin of toxin-antitoxin system
MTQPLRVVLDTNVVVTALVFGGGHGASVRAAWQGGQCVPLASTATVAELVRVLAYPKFRLRAADQAELLADYLPWVQVTRIPAPPPRVPACRDQDDLAFMHLAKAGRAKALVSGDKDLLALAGQLGACPILSLEEFCRLHLGAERPGSPPPRG